MVQRELTYDSRKRIVIIVIDGLGIGTNNNNSPNTLLSLMTYESSKKHSGVYQDLRSFVNSGICRATSSVVTPSYEGADSYKGHYEMIGVDVGIKSVFVEEHLESLREQYPQIDKIFDGIYTLQKKYYISNNIEAELGTSINLIGDLNESSWDELIDEGKKISTLLECQRVIIMANYGISRPCIIGGVRCRQDRAGKPVGGIIPSFCELYNDNYRSYHMGRPLDSYKTDNLIDSVLQNRDSIVLVGKVGDIFQAEHDAIINIPSVASRHTYDHLKQALKTDARLIFGNFQQVDLMGHACRPQNGLRNLLEICEYIDAIKSQLNKGDLLLVTADHGNDPRGETNAHTREQVPLLVYGQEEIGAINKSYTSLSCVSDITKLHLGIA